VKIDAAQITETDARKAGYPGKRALDEQLAKRGDAQLYRIAFELGGTDPRITLRQDDQPTDQDLDTITKRLARMDAHATNGPWTRQTLDLIANNPGTRAADLAPQLQQERLPFKANVRKLKELGLTISLERGYRLSPRGEAYLTLTTRTTARPR
jgi:hypothetical protein